MPTYAIGDIHGCLETLDALLDRIAPAFDDELIFLGDYIDRGPNSRGVIERVLGLREDGYRVTALLGNHEAMMDRALKTGDQLDFRTWWINGGRQTLESYRMGQSSGSHIAYSHRAFLGELKAWHKAGDVLYVHGGPDLGAEDPLADEEVLVWNRDWYEPEAFRRVFPDDRRVVHGHTPVPLERIERNLREGVPVINLDGGCVYKGRMPGLGWLVALEVEAGRLHAEACRDL